VVSVRELYKGDHREGVSRGIGADTFHSAVEISILHSFDSQSARRGTKQLLRRAAEGGSCPCGGVVGKRVVTF
jgi:hypothetical protein